MKKTIVIIGGVAGGASAAARLRRLDEQAEIIVLERGPYVSYANCGLPYHVGGVIPFRESLLLQTPEAMARKYRVDVRVDSEAVSIDRENRQVTVADRQTGEQYRLGYDTLVLAAGSSPMRPPIPGIESPRVATVWTVPDADRIRRLLADGVSRTVVIGGGFIGIEMAENLRHAGAQVTLVEAQPQVMAPFDFEMAQLLHRELTDNGVELVLGDGVARFEDREDVTAVHLSSGRIVEAQLVVLAIGVRPNSQLAAQAGLELNPRGGVVVDGQLRTSDPNIYAVGDMIQVEDFVSKGPAMVPLAGPANKQGRMAADNIMGAGQTYRGSQGTSVARVFGLTAASTGANERALQARGMEKDRDYRTVTVVQNDHAGYYPGARQLVLKLIFAADGGQILGAQVIGAQGVDKRIDVLSTAMRLGCTAVGLKELELAYAPPYSSAKDPVNMAGFTAENVVNGLVEFCGWDELGGAPETQILDVRETFEIEEYAIPGAVQIPLGQLRGRLDELDREREVVVLCAIGVRSYMAARVLSQSGFGKVKVYPGGTNFYRMTHLAPPNAGASDCTGKPCP